MTAADSNLARRGFLRALAAVPLLGGGLKLLGEPTGAAVPVSEDLLRRYLLFLGKEQQAARVELELVRSPWHFERYGYSLTDQATWKAGVWWMQIPADREIDGLVTRARASTRAAVVLGAAGVNLRPASP